MNLNLFDTTCLIQDVVSTPGGDTRMARRRMQFYDVIIRNAKKPNKIHTTSTKTQSNTLLLLCKYNKFPII